MRIRVGFFLIAALVVGVVAATPRAAAAQQRERAVIDVPVTIVAAAGETTGTFHLRRFSARGEQVFAVGTLSAEFPGIGMVDDEPLRVTVERVRVSCDVFRLVLGPADVDATDAAEADRVMPVAITELRMEVTADEDDDLMRFILCRVRDVIGGDGTVDLDLAALPLPADQVAQLLNRAIRLFR